MADDVATLLDNESGGDDFEDGDIPIDDDADESLSESEGSTDEASEEESDTPSAPPPKPAHRREHSVRDVPDRQHRDSNEHRKRPRDGGDTDTSMRKKPHGTASPPPARPRHMTSHGARIPQPLSRAWRKPQGLEQFQLIHAEASKMLPYPIPDLPKSSFARGDLYVRRMRTRMLAGLRRITILAQPGGGKTHLICAIINKMRNFYPATLVTNGSEAAAPFYERVVHQLHNHDTYNVKVNNRFANRQNIASRVMSNPMALNVTDDISDLATVGNNQTERESDTKGRQKGIARIRGIQSMKMLPTFSRLGTSTLMFRNITSADDLENIYKCWGKTIFPTAEGFYDCYKMVTSAENRWLVLNLDHNAPPEDRVMWYVAPALSSFAPGYAGHPQTLEHCERRYADSNTRTVVINEDF